MALSRDALIRLAAMGGSPYQQGMLGGIAPGSVPIMELGGGGPGFSTAFEQYGSSYAPGYLPGVEATLPIMGAGMNPLLGAGITAALGWIGSELMPGNLLPIGGGGGMGNAPILTGGGGGNGGGGSAAMVPLVGPGVKEPPNDMVKKRWETRVYDNELGYIKLNFYALVDGRIMMYHNYRKYWKIWRPKKMVVLSSNPRLSHLRKLDRVYKRTQKMVKKYAPKVRVTSRQAPSDFLSAAERKLLRAGT